MLVKFGEIFFSFSCSKIIDAALSCYIGTAHLRHTAVRDVRPHSVLIRIFLVVVAPTWCVDGREAGDGTAGARLATHPALQCPGRHQRNHQPADGWATLSPGPRSNFISRASEKKSPGLPRETEGGLLPFVSGSGGAAHAHGLWRNWISAGFNYRPNVWWNQ